MAKKNNMLSDNHGKSKKKTFFNETTFLPHSKI